MSHELDEGVELKRIQLDNTGDQIFLGPPVLSIIVVMQCGQMGMVPWAKVTRYSGSTGQTTQLINLDKVLSVDLL